MESGGRNGSAEPWRAPKRPARGSADRAWSRKTISAEQLLGIGWHLGMEPVRTLGAGDVGVSCVPKGDGKSLGLVLEDTWSPCQT